MIERYAVCMLLGGLVAGFLGIWLEVGFRPTAAVGVALGILAGHVLVRAESSRGEMMDGERMDP